MKKQVLIVEDNELNRAMLREILSGEYEVLEAENGQDALDILRRHRDRIALILLDVLMPVMDGYAFLDFIKKDDELSLIPVIVTTQSDSEENEVVALAHGATDFVPKPYRPQVILHRVANLIKLRETAAMVNQLQYDRLTGLYSKEFFYRKVRERLLEDPEQDYCIVCSNIENFKLVNDMFGAQAGDRLLKEVAAIAQAMVGSSGFCGRFSADRFVCLQNRKQEQQDRQNFGQFGDQGFSPLLKSLVMRWGIYKITDRSIPVEQMCDRAMLAVNSIKGQYNQFFAEYDDSLRDKLLREQAITDAMEAALDKGQFVVYYQPKYSLNRESIAGAEALVRWIHPEWGFMSPGEFIPLFEKNGFIPRLDQYVWERVCAQLRDWQDKGYQAPPVSVNVSRADVYQGDVVDTLLRLTNQYGVDPSCLHLEITESSYAENPGQIIHTVEELRKLGFVVEMDDFGSGYSSLNMLSQMKLDILKLDLAFTRNETAKPAEQSILGDIVAMAHRLHLKVVAEGVETREQTDRLRAVGCDYVQGYYFAKPMPGTEYEALLKTLPPQAEASVPEMLSSVPDQNSLPQAQKSRGQKAAPSSATAYFNLNTGNIRIMPDETETASDIPSGPICLDAYLNLLQIRKEDEARVRSSLSVEAIRRQLEEADTFRFRFPSAVAENRFEWNEIRVSLCERVGQAPSAVLLQTKNLNLIVHASRQEERKLRDVERLMEDCFSGFGAVFYNIILVNVNENSYMVQNPYGDNGAHPVIQPDGTYKNDNYAYGMSFVHPEDRTLFWSYTTLEAYKQRLTADGAYAHFRIRHILSNEYRWVQVNVVRLGADDDHFRVLYFINDIQDEVDKEEKARQLIEDALRHARTADEAKSTFLSSMSHDIRTPLNAISGMTLLARKNLSDSGKLEDYLGKIDLSCKLLTDIINEVLDISMIESGKLTMEIAPFRLEDIVQKLVVLIQPQACDKRIDLRIDMEQTRHRYLKGDSVQLFKLLSNLLTNAVKYTPCGGHVSLIIEELEQRFPDRGLYRFVCRDDGIGMSEEFRKRAFAPFERERDETVQKIQGTGLGLTIIKSLTEAMGGEITLESVKGWGTTFTVTIGFPVMPEAEKASPLQEPKNQRPEQDNGIRLDGYHILLVDDNALNREIAVEILTSIGAAVDTAADGWEAVQKFRASDSSRYDFILMDIRMPDMDGYQTTELIRRQEGSYAAQIPIIAMTAEAFSEEMRRAYDCGMTAYISKPIVMDELMKTILSVLKN